MIPKNWLECPWFSKETILDLFIASKTFLDKTYRHSIPESFRYEPSYLIEMEKHFGKKIGVVIDLNNSKRYYQPSDIEALGKKHYKIFCAGHMEAPTKPQVDTFINICKQHEESSPDELILVHCTHGYNRTCFMIAGYLFEERMMDLKTSIEYLSKIRTPGIYKQDYVDDLLKMYGSSDQVIAARKPQWNFKDIKQQYSQPTNNISNVHKPPTTSTNYHCSSNIPVKPVDQETVQFCVSGLGINPACDEDAFKVRKRLNEIFPSFGNVFPGSQPVSMDANNVKLIQNDPYSISWKADGTRYLMYISVKDEVYMVDRDFNVFKVPSLVFPFTSPPSNPDNPKKNDNEMIMHTYDTLVDGEMIIERVNELEYPRFMIYDLIHLNGTYCGNDNFWVRYHHIRVNLIDPRDFHMQSGTFSRQSQTFSVRRKQFYELKYSNHLIKDVIPKITHLIDGIIFQPINEPYTPGTCQSILKWKPPHLNTIDFKLMISTVKAPGCLVEKKVNLYLGGSPQSFGEIKYSDSIEYLHNKVVECNLVSGGWNIIRIREDKSFANSISTAKAVMDSIINPVSEKDLYKILCIEN